MKIKSIIISILFALCSAAWADGHDPSDNALVISSNGQGDVFETLVSQLSVKSLSKKKKTLEITQKSLAGSFCP